ncbi:hypothetical protein DL96DRAFT_847949 [Flagelloscypha sp. PMI_526]|nr:hypothetical protein DL96DRAFT_847949 [Flagelloscypha sp. PMI_526]
MTTVVPSYRRFVERLLLHNSSPDTIASPAGGTTTTAKPDHSIHKKQIHIKGKGGCKTCKKRRVKCDQSSFPSCLNCTKRGVQCDWPPPIQARTVAKRTDPHVNGPTIQPIFTQGLSHYDLELLHHFTTMTAVSLLDVHNIESPPVLDIYQRHGPRLALAHPFLMHSLLALSALHLHWLTRQSEPSTTSPYYILSCYHRTNAVQTYNYSQCEKASCNVQCVCGGRSDAQFLTNLILSLHALCDVMVDIPGLTHPTVRTVYWYTKGKERLDTFYSTKNWAYPRRTNISGVVARARTKCLLSEIFLAHFTAHLRAFLCLLYSILSTCQTLEPQMIPSFFIQTLRTLLRYTQTSFTHFMLGIGSFFERHAPMRVVMIWVASMLPKETGQLLAQRRTSGNYGLCPYHDFTPVVSSS